MTKLGIVRVLLPLKIQRLQVPLPKRERAAMHSGTERKGATH